MKHYLMIFSLTVFYSYSQSTDFKFKICTDSTVTSKHETNDVLFLIGEYHVQHGNFKIHLSYYDYLKSKGLSPKYIIEEGAPSYGYVMTKYLKTGDEFLLDIMGVDSNFRQIFRDLALFYKSLPDDKKFKYVGVDFERLVQIAHYAVRDILLQSNLYCDYKSFAFIEEESNCFDEKEVCYLFSLFKRKENPISWGRKNLKEDLTKLLDYVNSQDSLIIKDHLSSELYTELSIIMKSFEISKKRRRLFVVFERTEFQVEREKFMTNNIYRLFVNDPHAIVYGQFGIDHVLLSTYNKHPKPDQKMRLAIDLNNNPEYPLTNHKVCSNIIYYDYFKPNSYKFLQSDLSKINSEFTKMKDCELLIKDFENKSKATNLILFKTQHSVPVSSFK